MRKTRLKKVSLVMAAAIVSVIVVLAVLRTFIFHSAEWYAVEGEKLFVLMGCDSCHLTDSTETLVGPGLKGLTERDRLPASGREVTGANIRRQLIDPFKNMPSYEEDLSGDEIKLLVDYLESL